MARGLTFSYAAKSSTVKISEWDCAEGIVVGVGACMFWILSSVRLIFTDPPQH